MVANGQRSTLPRYWAHQLSGAIASVEDYEACRKVMRAASANYTYASRFLPKNKRHHVEALYALMRIGDDRVDVSHNGFDSPMEAIEDWEIAYWRAFERGDSPDPVLRAYLNTAWECGIPAQTMQDYFRAMKEDLTVTRFPTFDDLMHYMAGSAIPVGRAMTHILGVRDPYVLSDALVGADSLSIAMQLSNFWRDIGEDWERSRRIYIPLEDMARFDYRESDLAAGRINRNFVELLEFEFDRTEGYYQYARQSVKLLATGRWGVMGGLEIYRAILADIRRNSYNVFAKRARATKFGKIGLALHAGLAVIL